MPSLITHYYCGQRSLDLLQQTDDSNYLHFRDKYKQAFNLGTQGGDIFFYEGVLPWSKKYRINFIGSKLHSEKINKFFSSMLSYIKWIAEYSQSSKKDQSGHLQVLIAYFMGYLSHYCLDAKTHPYIYYHSGFDKDLESTHNKYACYHYKFETAIDILFLSSASSVSVHKYIDVEIDDLQLIADMLSETIYNTYNLKITANQVLKSAIDMKNTYAVLKDRFGLKRPILGVLEKIILKSEFVTSNMYPKAIDNSIDYLNTEKNAWHVPWDSTAVSHDGFLDLYEQAAQDTFDLWWILEQYLNDDLSLDLAVKKLGNRSFTTGLDCDTPVTFSSHRCVYE